MSAPGKKRGKTMNDETVKKVEDFFRNDEISRTLPGYIFILIHSVFSFKFPYNSIVWSTTIIF